MQLVDRCQEAAAEAGCNAVPLDVARIPFTIHLNEGADAESALADLPTTAEDLGQPSTEASSGASPEALAEAEAACERQAQAVRALKDSGHGNQDPEVQAQVKKLLEAKVRFGSWVAEHIACWRFKGPFCHRDDKPRRKGIETDQTM